MRQIWTLKYAETPEILGDQEISIQLSPPFQLSPLSFSSRSGRVLDKAASGGQKILLFLDSQNASKTLVFSGKIFQNCTFFLLTIFPPEASENV